MQKFCFERVEEGTLFLPGQRSIPIQRLKDGASLCVYFTGGVRASLVDEPRDHWVIDSFIEAGAVVARAGATKPDLYQLARIANLEAVGFQHVRWIDGEYYGFWRPVVGENAKGAISASDIWSNISSNLAKVSPNSNAQGSIEEIATARFISIELRNADVAIEAICEYYCEELQNALFRGSVDGNRFGSARDINLYAHVHSFFVHLGAARDYLAALIALRLGKALQGGVEKNDSMGRLILNIRDGHVDGDQILSSCKKNAFIIPSSKSDRWEAGEWLSELSVLRNRFVHKSPYGTKAGEEMGTLQKVSGCSGLYRYARHLEVEPLPATDVLECIARHYKRALKIFSVAASATGWDTTIPSFGPNELKSVNLTRYPSPETAPPPHPRSPR